MAKSRSRNKKLMFLLTGMAILMLLSCENSFYKIDLENAGHKFYPLEIGNYRKYKVFHIKYSFLGNHDTLHYFLKEQVAGTFTNQSGGIRYQLNRYKKMYDSLAWEFDSTWTVDMTSTNVVVVENNVPFVKLVFPILEKKKWDGNAFNVMSEELYSYENVNQSTTLSENTYNSTVKVIHNNNTDPIIGSDIRNEIYAENIGLIYKESIILHYCTDNECLGNMIIEQGSDYRQEIIGYGKD
jgi:hypothetical protein